MLNYHQLPQRGSNRDSSAALPQEDSIGVANLFPPPGQESRPEPSFTGVTDSDIFEF